MACILSLVISFRMTCKVNDMLMLPEEPDLPFSEYVPYVFQLFAALLEANPSRNLTTYYMSLIQPILSPELWASKGNIPALVRLLSSMMTRGASQIAETNQLESILAIFQSLITTKANEVYGFELLESIVANSAP